MEENLYLT